MDGAPANFVIFEQELEFFLGFRPGEASLVASVLHILDRLQPKLVKFGGLGSREGRLDVVSEIGIEPQR